VDLSPQIFFGKVMHKRMFPKVNAFTYGIYYLALPLSKIQGLKIPLNRFGFLSFYAKDHGYRDERSLTDWARGILAHYDVTEANGEIILVCMPRIFGYVFNPVSFWLCLDQKGSLRAVICEVNNTFGESHAYLCRHEDLRPIVKEDVLKAEKLFHVSPFLEREGHYKFRFHYTPENFGAWIDFYDARGEKKLLTSLLGQFQPMSPKSLRHAFWGYPLVTFKTIALIHFQAIKLLSKGIRHIKKPVQKQQRLSTSQNITEI
jgi:uncharacterized protein